MPPTKTRPAGSDDAATLSPLRDHPEWGPNESRLRDLQASAREFEADYRGLVRDRRSIEVDWKTSAAEAIAAGKAIPPRPDYDLESIQDLAVRVDLVRRAAGVCRRTLDELLDLETRRALALTKDRRLAIFRRQADAYRALADALDEEEQYRQELDRLGYLPGRLERLYPASADSVRATLARFAELVKAHEGVDIT